MQTVDLCVGKEVQQICKILDVSKCINFALPNSGILMVCFQSTAKQIHLAIVFLTVDLSHSIFLYHALLNTAYILRYCSEVWKVYI